MFWTCFLFAGSLSREDIFQSPSELLVDSSTELRLTLTHQIKNYDTILWYQRLNGDTSLKLIAYMYYEIPNVENTFNHQFSVSGNGDTSAHLHISNLTTTDSGVYFGAASQGTQLM